MFWTLREHIIVNLTHRPMKRIQALLLFIVLLPLMVTAQNQLENAGFEQWEDILVSDPDTIREPVDWSSLKTSDDATLSTLAPVVCTRSNDAHSGDYSVKLTNVDGFLIANGVATNGRVHPNILNTDSSYMFTDPEDAHWNTPFTERPDSIAGWLKYMTLEDDTMQVKVILHEGYAQSPDPDYAQNWVGEAQFKSPLNTEGEWVRFSTPFTYYMGRKPEYVLVILNSGNGYSPAAGSELLIDDLEMIYNPDNSTADRQKQLEGSIFAVSNQHLIIQGMDHTLFQTIKILDMSGKLIWAGQVTADQVDISSAHLENGLYLVNLSGKSAVFTQKILLR